MFGTGGKLDFEPALLRVQDRRHVAGLGRPAKTHGPDARDRDGRMRLLRAASRGDVEISRLALAAGWGSAMAHMSCLIGARAGLEPANDRDVSPTSWAADAPAINALPRRAV
jgi:hypothetical protein